MGSKQDDIINYLRENGKCTVRQIAKALRLDRQNVNNTLMVLKTNWNLADFERNPEKKVRRWFLVKKNADNEPAV